MFSTNTHSGEMMKMVKFFSIVLMLISFAACSSRDFKNNPGKTPEEVIANAVYYPADIDTMDQDLLEDLDDFYEEEIHSGNEPESIFLGYKPGMSEKEVNDYTGQLQAKGKLHEDEDGIYYNFNLAGKSPKAYITFSYYEDKLIQLCLTISSYYTPELDDYQNELLHGYIRKYILERKGEKRAFFYKADKQILWGDEDPVIVPYSSYGLLIGKMEIYIFTRFSELHINYSDKLVFEKLVKLQEETAKNTDADTEPKARLKSKKSEQLDDL